MAAGPSDLTTLAALKDWLGVASDTTDALLQRLLSQVSVAIQNNINRQFATQAYSESRSGVGGRRMQAANYPLLTVSSVTVDGLAIPLSTDGVNACGYASDERGITLIGYCFSRGTRNVQLAYTAGFASTPADVELACIEWCAFIYRSRDRIGHASKSFNGEVVSYIVAAMPNNVALTLAQYKKVVPL
jgi:hypothetical protein